MIRIHNENIKILQKKYPKKFEMYLTTILISEVNSF